MQWRKQGKWREIMPKCDSAVNCQQMDIMHKHCHCKWWCCNTIRTGATDCLNTQGFSLACPVPTFLELFQVRSVHKSKHSGIVVGELLWAGRPSSSIKALKDDSGLDWAQQAAKIGQEHYGLYGLPSGAVLAQKFWALISTFITESISPFSETEKYKLHIGLHLKSIISGVANSVMG